MMTMVDGLKTSLDADIAALALYQQKKLFSKAVAKEIRGK